MVYKQFAKYAKMVTLQVRDMVYFKIKPCEKTMGS